MLNLVGGVTVPAPGSASQTAVRRLQKDYAKLMQDPVDGISALPNEDNILEWHYCLRGSQDTPFQGGYYWGKVIFKENFPWSPPAITMITPNGRFAPNTRLCLSISDYHPESWNPGWTVSAILIGLHSFMNENQPAAGSVVSTPQEQKNLAAASKEFNVKYREFRRFFPQYVQEWTGVLPTADEPDVAPTMLPEHATPRGVEVPTMGAPAPRAAFGRAMRHAEQMLANRRRAQGIVDVPGAPRDPEELFGELYALGQPNYVPPVVLDAPGALGAPPPLQYHDYYQMAAAAGFRAGQAPPPPVNAAPPVARAPRHRLGAHRDEQIEERRAERLARFGMDGAARRGARRGDQVNEPIAKRTRRGGDNADDAIVLN